MIVAVVSPEQVLYEGEAAQVITRTTEGEVAFLAGPQPFLGVLVPSTTRVYLADGSVKEYAVEGGFVEVSDSTVSILSA